MGTDYNWHMQQATDRLQARYREAEQHRLTKQARGCSTSPIVLKLIPVLLAVLTAILLLT